MAKNRGVEVDEVTSVQELRSSIEAVKAGHRDNVTDKRDALASCFADFVINPSADAYRRMEIAMMQYQDITKNYDEFGLPNS